MLTPAQLRTCVTVLTVVTVSTVLCGAPLPAPSQPASPASSLEPSGSALRICASKNQPPFSLADGSGYENKIAIALAEALGRKPQFVWADKPAIYLVRDFLDRKLCDVVVGLDAGDQRVLTTEPYFRSGYVFVSRANRNLDVKSWSDPALKSLGHIIVAFGSPGEVMLKDIGRYEDEMAYLYSLVNFRSPRNQYTQIDPARMISEVTNGSADLAVAFAPEVARFVQSSATPLRMTVLEDHSARSDGTKIPQHYDQSMGVRRDDKVLLEKLNEGLRRAKAKIDEILAFEGIPLLPAAQ